MARLVHSHAYPTLRLPGQFNLGHWLFMALQVAVLAGIGLFLVLAIVNSIVGTPQPEPVYSPYD